jgi:hypothetical protein
VAGIAGLNLGAKFAPPENRVTTLGAALLKNFPQEWTVDGSLAESMKSRALLGWDGGALTRKLALSIGPNLGETMFTTLAESLARVDGYYNHLLNAALPRPWKDARSPIRAMLTGWEGLLHQGGEMARAMARVALMAAMRAREAVVQGDEDFVREFVIRWLRRKPQPWVMEAAAMVLLENEWLPADLDADGYEVIEKLRVLVGRYTRYYKPLEATQIRGRKIRSLDKPVGFNTLGEPITLLEVSPDPGAADPAELWSVDDPRLVHALARFKPEEQAVIEHSLATTKQHGRKPHSRSDCHPTMGKRCGGSVNEWPRKSIGKWLPSPRSPSPDRDVWSALAPFRRGCG